MSPPDLHRAAGFTAVYRDTHTHADETASNLIDNFKHTHTHTENGLLSYENPNYHMNAQRIERNSHLYEEILSELQLQKQQQHQQNCSSKSAKRAAAAMQTNSMDAAALLAGDNSDLQLDRENDGEEAMGQQKIGAGDMQGNNRKQYARLDVSAMGVDLKENFM